MSPSHFLPNPPCSPAAVGRKLPGSPPRSKLTSSSPPRYCSPPRPSLTSRKAPSGERGRPVRSHTSSGPCVLVKSTLAWSAAKPDSTWDALTGPWLFCRRHSESQDMVHPHPPRRPSVARSAAAAARLVRMAELGERCQPRRLSFQWTPGGVGQLASQDTGSLP